MLCARRLLLYAGGGAFALHALAVGAVLLLSLFGPRVMLPAGCALLIPVGLFGLGVGSIRAMATTRGSWRPLPVLALALVPATFLLLEALLVLEALGRPVDELDRITLPDDGW